MPLGPYHCEKKNKKSLERIQRTHYKFEFNISHLHQPGIILEKPLIYVSCTFWPLLLP